MTVELFGMARAIVGAPSVDLALVEPASPRDLFAALAGAHPRLLGTVIAASHDALLEPHVLLLDGRRAPHPEQATIVDADRPCILLVPSGG